MPSPPTSLGLHIFSQATKHWPLFTLSFPTQKKAHIHLFMSYISHTGASATTIWCTTLAETTELIRTSLPSFLMRPRCQAGTHLITLSRRGCHFAFVRGFRANCSLMSTHASIPVDSVGPPRAEVCRTSASFP
jgi:hypothetical protein